MLQAEDIILKVKMEITLYFQANPGTWETAKGVALRLGRSDDIVYEGLQRLVALGLLEQLDTGVWAIYHYVRPYISSGLDAEYTA